MERKKLKRELEDKWKLIELRDKEIADLKAVISRSVVMASEVIYSK